MHLKHVPKSFRKALFKYMYEAYPEYKEKRNKLEDEEYKRRDRDYEKSKEGEDKKDKSRKSPDKLKREEEAPPQRDMTSEERRAMIAMWNQEGSQF